MASFFIILPGYGKSKMLSPANHQLQQSMKSLFDLLWIHLKNLTRKRFWFLFLAIGVGFSIGSYIFVYRIDPFTAIPQMTYGQVILSIVFMMMGIEIRREQRNSNLDELFSSCSSHLSIVAILHLVIIMLLSLTVFFMIGIVCFFCMFLDHAPGIWIRQSLSHIALFYCLPCIISGFWGLLISQINRGKSVFLPAVLVWFLTSSLCTYVLDIIPFRGDSFFRTVLHFMNLGLDSFHMFRNIVTGTEIEVPRWIVRICLLLITGVFYLCFYIRELYGIHNKKKKITYIGLPITLGIILLTLNFFRFHDFYAIHADPSDALQYVYKKSDQYIPGKLASIEEYPEGKYIQLKKTTIDLWCRDDGIQACVVLDVIQEKTQTKQSFTLYSDLIIDRITVNGKTASYARSLDGVLVDYPETIEAGKALKIIFEYHGYTLPSFPANATTVQLNRAFPWFPWPGIRQISSKQDSFDETERFFIADWQRTDTVEYVLHYQGPGNLYCSLPEESKGTFHGEASGGISLYSGMLKTEYNGIDVYVPASQYRLQHYPGKAVLTFFDHMADTSKLLQATKQPDTPRSVVWIQMRVPVLADFPMELYNWGAEWEIRTRNESSAVIGTMILLDLGRTKEAEIEIIKAATGYVVSPAAGFPPDVQGKSKDCFVRWLNLYLSRNMWRNLDVGPDKELFLSEHGMLESDEETDMAISVLDAILDDMNFDETFRELYVCLAREKNISSADMIRTLYSIIEQKEE